jgi:two-component system, chemotaxis family, sensor kinase CheA
VSNGLELDIQRFRHLFLEEAVEHMSTLETGLLALEQTPDDPELIASVFRAAHSIKGASASVGLTEIAELTHAMESLLERVRAGLQPATAALTSVLLRASDILQELLGDARKGRPPTVDRQEILAELQRAIVQDAGGGSADISPPVPVSAEAGELQIQFRPGPDIYLMGHDPLRVLRELADMGEVSRVQLDGTQLPPLAEMDPERSSVGWTLRLRTEQSTAQVRDVFAFVEDGSQIEISAAAATPSAPAADAQNPRPEASETRSRTAAPVESTTLRVDIEKVDRLINLVGELVISQSMISQVVTHFTPDKLARLQEAMVELERNTRELQERVMAVRMVPVSTVFSRFPRLARDLSGALGKNVRIEVAGGDTEIDKSVVERIGDPLTHLVRNAIDHGIELPADRIAAGKPEHGTVKLVAFHQGGNVMIQIEDDGRGLDVERIRRKAVAQGLIAADSQHSNEELQALIFRPGFSTAEAVTDVSGRGVGMDVVRTNIEALNGSIQLQSNPGQGTCFRIGLPLTLAIIDGLCVSVADEVYIVPLGSIVQSFCPAPGELKTIAGRGEVVLLRGQVLPLLRLRRLFSVPARAEAPAQGIVVVIENQGSKVGLFVDDVVGQAQVVIKSLEANFRRVEGVMGATILGDGRVGLILDVQGLARIGHGPKSSNSERRAAA